ncbi:MAG: hypothetical protein ACT4OK_20245 [Gemmobacter sp.]
MPHALLLPDPVNGSLGPQAMQALQFAQRGLTDSFSGAQPLRASVQAAKGPIAMGGHDNQSEPGTGTYILAWILASVAANLASYAIAFVAFGSIRTMDDFMQRTMFVMPVSIVVVAGVMLGVYSQFPKVNVSKVVPYFWGLGALGLIASLVRTGSSGVEFPGLYYVLAIVEFVLTLLALMWGFRRLGRL